MNHSAPHAHTESACCHKSDTQQAHASKPPAHAQHAAHGSHGNIAGWGGAARITLHCLTGCAIGEWLGLAIGVSLGLSTVQTITLAVVLAFLSGFALTLTPLVRGGLSLSAAFKIVWLGEAISIAVMELVMNVVDYQLGGMATGMSLLHPQYWIAFTIAALAGYLAAWPANYWLLSRSIKKACH
jgi:hypothetical protein